MAIARTVIGENATQQKLDQIAEQAAGSPLFAEELARVMATGKAASTAPTIEAAIQVSLDTLTPDARDALLQMSVLGIAVWDDALRSLGVEKVDAAKRSSYGGSGVFVCGSASLGKGGIQRQATEWMFRPRKYPILNLVKNSKS